MAHYTDEHIIKRGSSIDLIERCAAFLRQSGDFEGVLDYGEDESNPGYFQDLLRKLNKEAMRIIAKECE
jgi:hypothetical protein